MATPTRRTEIAQKGSFDTIRRAYAEFLWLPTAIIIGFLLLAAGAYWLDRASFGWLEPIHTFLRTHVFTDVQATSDLLSTIATGIMTVTSVTISLLLLALQQSANAMTTEIFDQFLRRRHNQFYFGFFVGLALYALITLATVNKPFNPVFGATIAFLLTVVALYLLIVLLYTTINQMRPVEVINTIHNHTLAARHRQLPLIARTRRQSQGQGTVQFLVKTQERGTVTHIQLDTIAAAIGETQAAVEVVLAVAIGDYVAFQDPLARVLAPTQTAAQAVGAAVQRALLLERQRDITTDPAYGIEQLTIIAWSSISTAKSDPAPGLLAINSLRDILARWSAETVETSLKGAPEPVAVVYPDPILQQPLKALESLAVVSSESMQHQTFAAVLCTLADLFDRLPPAQQQQAESIILRLLSTLGDHALTTTLEQALSTVADALAAAGKVQTAATVCAAQTELRQTIGALHSRATRAKDRNKR